MFHPGQNDKRTTLQENDEVQYSQKYDWVKVIRGMRALNVVHGDDKIPMDSFEFEDFEMLCNLMAHVASIGIKKVYAKRQHNKIWRCRFGSALRKRTRMLLNSWDRIKYSMESGTFEILRRNEVLKTISWNIPGDVMLNLGSICRILASCRGLDVGGIDIEGDLAWSFTVQPDKYAVV